MPKKEPLLPVSVPGLHAYADKSVEAGGSIRFWISSDRPGECSQIEVMRPELTLNDKRLFPPGTDPVPSIKLLSKPVPVSQQDVTPGSYVNVDNALPETQALSALTLECWVRPAQLPSNQPQDWWGLISQHSHPDECGFGMFLGDDGSLALYFGNGGQYDRSKFFVYSEEKLSAFVWAHIVGVWDGSQVFLYINGKKCDPPEKQQYQLSGPVIPGPAPFRLAAYGENDKTTHILEGDLAMPVIYSRALSADEVQKRYAGRGLPPSSLDNVLACWPLKEEKGDTIADITQHNRTGTIINQATWMIGGPSFNADDVPRFKEYDPSQDLTRGNGLRFASDDLYDAGWNTTVTATLPKELKPGIYVARIRYKPASKGDSDSGSSEEKTYDVTFVVKKSKDVEKERVVVLCATNTWLAYACTPFVENYAAKPPPPVWGNDGLYKYIDGKVAGLRTAPPPGTPGYNFYTNHLFGQPTYQVGMNLPWPGANPDVRYFGDELDYSHLTRAELFTHYWLDKNHYGYDVITDFDLHKDPTALDGYKVLLIAGHSEYWSTQAYQAVDNFLKGGNDVIVLSGNTMFWRVSFDPNFKSMQCRKEYDLPGGRSNSNTGETWHSGDNQRGGLMRECGHPTGRLLGMESAGLWNKPYLNNYTCDMPEHELFQAPHKIVLDPTTHCLAAQAVGHEFDVTLALKQQSDVGYPEPPDIVPVQPDRDRIQTLGHSGAYWNDWDLTHKGQVSYEIWDYRVHAADAKNKELYGSLRSSEVIYWERLSGGRVFYAGSIAAGQALWGGKPSDESSWVDNQSWQDLLRNVLHKFGVEPNHTTTS